MSMKQALALLDLSKELTSAKILELRHCIGKHGAFRLVAPGIQNAFDQTVPHAERFFHSESSEKAGTKGHAPIGTENVRGETQILKESLYYGRTRDEVTAFIKNPPTKLSTSIAGVHEVRTPTLYGIHAANESECKEWTKLRRLFLKVLSKDILDSTISLTDTPQLEYETIGLHYYSPRTMAPEQDYYNPPHRDGGTVTILVRRKGLFDGLEIADLETTQAVDSGGKDLEYCFLPVPVVADEVIVFLGTRIQRLFNRDTVRACVHRVRAPPRCFPNEERFSLAIFCAPPFSRNSKVRGST